MTVAPAVSIIDRSAIPISSIIQLLTQRRAVTESVSGRATLLGSVQSSLYTMVLRPHRFFIARPFAIMLFLYSSTYLSANTVDTASSIMNNKPADTVTSGLPKFLAVSAVNLNLSLFKDVQYAKMFGTTAPTALPRASYGIFIVRDCMTLFASFNVPQMIAPRLPPSVDGYISRLSAAQVATPVMMQIFGTPLHLLGLDLYNRNRALAWADRWTQVKRAWPRTTVARMCRVLPAFGIGGVVNTKTRTSLMSQINAP